MINARHMLSIHEHRYVHRSNLVPPDSSVILSLLHKQQIPSNRKPALIDLVLQDGSAVLKVIWEMESIDSNGKETTTTVSFDEKTDKVVEVGWFYRELKEQEYSVYDHYYGAVVKLDAEGEVVGEALIQTRSSVFPGRKLKFSTGEVHGHGYASTMSSSQTLHPRSITTIRSNPYIDATTGYCDLYVIQLLPPSIFVDPLQLQSLEPDIGRAIVYGEIDLEKPVDGMVGKVSLVMVKVQPENSVMTSRWIAEKSTKTITIASDKGESSSKSSSYTSTVVIPMHMQYQSPVSEDDLATHVNVAVLWPIVAWACPTAASSNEEPSPAVKKLFHIPVLPLSLLFPKEGDKDAVDFRFVLPDPIPKRFPEDHVSVPVSRPKRSSESHIFVSVSRPEDAASSRLKWYALYAVVGSLAFLLVIRIFR